MKNKYEYKITHANLHIWYATTVKTALLFFGLLIAHTASGYGYHTSGSDISSVAGKHAASMLRANDVVFLSERILEVEEKNMTTVLEQTAKTAISGRSTFFLNQYRRTWHQSPVLAVKTNLLFDLSSAINVELEIPIGDRWSVAGEYIFPWWLLDDKQYCLQLINGNLEGRYWFGDRVNRTGLQPVLTGWFAGIYAGGGYYDIEWGKKGYQGEFYTVGLTGGYAHTLGRNQNLRMEYSLGVGYLKTNYREYAPVPGNYERWALVRRNSGMYSWLGPTRIRISLVWMFRSSGRRRAIW